MDRIPFGSFGQRVGAVSGKGTNAKMSAPTGFQFPVRADVGAKYGAS